MKKFTFLLLGILLAVVINAQVTIWNEDFSTSPGYTVTLGAEGNNGTADYFQKTDGTNIGVTYTGNVGVFFAAQDIDDNGWTGSAAPSELTWSNINISGYNSLSFEGLFASAATEKIDANDYAIIQINIDGVGWVNLLAFENDGTTYNTYFLEDTDFDGTGDGTQLTSSFSSFIKSIPVTGNSMDIKITVSVNSAGEDFAFDEFKITGTSSTIPVLTWNKTTFNEASANDGSIDNTISVTLSNETFVTTGVLTEGTHYTVANIPNGLTAAILVTSTTEASIGLTGNAINHTNADDVNNLTIVFVDNAFTGGDASAVANSSKNNLVVDFIDGSPVMEMTWDTTAYYESIANDGSISNLITVTLNNETFATIGTLVSGTDYTQNNVPAGLSFEVITTSSTTATIALTGNATSHAIADNINNLSIAFLDNAFTDGDANSVANSTKTDLTINFRDSYATNLVITEIMYNPPESGTDSLEYIEIYNNGTNAANLINFTLSGITYTFGDTTINSGDYIIVAPNPAAINSFFGVSALQASGGLSNSGELVGLYNPAGDAVDEVTYDDVTPWPTSYTDGGGHSLVLCDYNSDNSDGANWTISTSYVDTIFGAKKVWGSPANSDVICSTNPKISWSELIFNESYNDDGSIDNSVQLTLTDDNFISTGLMLKNKDYIVANVPAGLTIEITVNSTTTATIALTGNAASHTNADDISNLEITFTDTIFASGYAKNITGYTNTLSVDFIDATSIDNNSNSNLSIYPNPTNHKINISGVNHNKVEIIDITGKIIIETTNNIIDLSKISNGIYFVKVLTNNETYTSRIVLDK